MRIDSLDGYPALMAGFVGSIKGEMERRFGFSARSSVIENLHNAYLARMQAGESPPVFNRLGSPQNATARTMFLDLAEDAQAPKTTARGYLVVLHSLASAGKIGLKHWNPVSQKAIIAARQEIAPSFLHRAAEGATAGLKNVTGIYKMGIMAVALVGGGLILMKLKK